MSAPAPRWRGDPAGSRRPLTSTSVRFAPSPRRLSVAVPVDAFDCPAFWFVNTCGRFRNASSTRTVPWDNRSSASVRIIGLALVRSGLRIRDPVTTSSSSCRSVGSAPGRSSSAARQLVAVASKETDRTITPPARTKFVGTTVPRTISFLVGGIRQGVVHGRDSCGRSGGQAHRGPFDGLDAGLPVRPRASEALSFAWISKHRRSRTQIGSVRVSALPDPRRLDRTPDLWDVQCAGSPVRRPMRVARPARLILAAG